ncbi:hypothetical protein [Mycolicibacterium litorale]|nr:hypothetical protein [Mycolicibacterium litorale]MCV7413792.1 hypothetical protein [Mycolicibacterium litorale]
MDVDSRTPAWRDPLSIGWRAHRQILMLRFRWTERRHASSRHGRPH